MLFRRPRPQLFPYTTLFRSDRARTLALHVDGAAVRPEVWRQAGTQLTDTAAAVVAGGLTAAGTPADEDPAAAEDRKSTRLNSSHVKISYAVFCLKKKNKKMQ